MVKTIEFQKHGDERGSLIALEYLKEIPFEIRRIYYIFGTLPGVERGFHAHLNLKQVAICVSGYCTFVLDDGKIRQEVLLDSPGRGLLIEDLIWREMKDFSPDCVLLVLADQLYDESDYIRNYESFLKFACKVK
jgi:dTDP-4-dehydrorhamnose 3,5-epimerase-like enzyme